MSRAGAVQQSKSEHHATPSRGREARRLSLRGQRRAQDWRDLPQRGVLINRVVVWIDERHRRLNVRRDGREEGGVDEDVGRLRAKPIVLSPQFGLSEVFKRTDARGEVDDALRAGNRAGDCLTIEQIEIRPPGSVDLVALGTGQGGEGTSDCTSPPGDK
jgi:hypothetical protein